MRIDFIKCMIELLERHQQVALPGLGSLYLSRNNATIKGNKLHPPFYEISFDEKIEEVSVFVDYLRDTYKLSKENAEKVLKKFSQRLINRLVNYNEVFLPQIGVLKNGGSSPIKLVENADGINFYKNYLPILNLKKVEKVSNTYTALASAALTTEVITPTSVVQTQDTVADTYNSEQTFIRQESIEEDSWFMQWWPFLGLLLLLLCLILMSKMCGNNAPPIAEDTIDEVVADTITTEELVYDPNRMYEEHELDQIPQDELESGCVIIVGSFKKAKNAVKMVSLIESKGYNSFTNVNDDGFTRTGILFNCLDEDLVAFLHSIRGEFEPKAWYLQPRLHIEYQ